MNYVGNRYPTYSYVSYIKSRGPCQGLARMAVVSLELLGRAIGICQETIVDKLGKHIFLISAMIAREVERYSYSQNESTTYFSENRHPLTYNYLMYLCRYLWDMQTGMLAGIWICMPWRKWICRIACLIIRARATRINPWETRNHPTPISASLRFEMRRRARTHTAFGRLMDSTSRLRTGWPVQNFRAIKKSTKDIY